MTIPRQALRPDFDVPRIIKGNWQIADDHSMAVDPQALYSEMAPFVDAGVTTFDCGDIYTGVEERIGAFVQRFRRDRGAEAARAIRVHTKYNPGFLDDKALRTHSRKDAEHIIDRSLRRLQSERLDLVQLHWWDYDVPGSVEAALMLEDMKKAGKIHHIGTTNYNVAELRKLVEAGVDVVVNQVQYSLTDRRPQHGMADYCAAHNVQLVCYGGLGGGLFSQKWLGIPDPGKPTFENVSLDKYYRIICDFGGWALFQELLGALDAIAVKHGVTIPAVAARYVLEQPAVAAVIQGARHARHIPENVRLFTFALDTADKAALQAVLVRATGPHGDCYDIDRIENRDALENLAPVYFDVEDGRLVTKTREIKPPAEIYGHHIGR